MGIEIMTKAGKHVNVVTDQQFCELLKDEIGQDAVWFYEARLQEYEQAVKDAIEIIGQLEKFLWTVNETDLTEVKGGLEGLRWT